MPAGAAVDSQTLYRQRARRLRGTLRDDPATLHRSLQALSQWQALSSPARAPGKVWKAKTSTDHVQNLIAGVVRNMEGPILRYPARQALLKQARRAGLEQFDANLIITAVQHKMGERIERKRPVDRPWIRHLAIAVIFQAWICAGVYWLLT